MKNTSPWQRFWQATEAIPGPEAVLAEWRLHVGDDFDVSRYPLWPTKQLAASVPVSSDPCRPRLEVVRHGDNYFEGVDPSTGDVVKLRQQDVLVYRLDHAKIIRGIADLLGLTGSVADVGAAVRASMIGHYRPFAGYQFPVYFFLASDAAEFQQAAEAIAARNDGPFILTAPTGRFLAQAASDLLKKAGACFLPLCESVTLESSGKWHLTEMGNQHLQGFAAVAIPAVNEVIR